MAMTENEMKKLSLELMECSECVFISTINDDGFPSIRAMNNLRNAEYYPKLKFLFEDHDEDFLILLSTNTSSEKVAHIRKKPKVSAYFKKPGVWQGIAFIGEMEIVEGAEGAELKKKMWSDDWAKYYPSGYNDPDHTLLRLYPKRAKGWNSEKITQFKFNIW
jgi:general stress protein 26